MRHPVLLSREFQTRAGSEDNQVRVGEPRSRSSEMADTNPAAGSRWMGRKEDCMMEACRRNSLGTGLATRRLVVERTRWEDRC